MRRRLPPNPSLLQSSPRNDDGTSSNARYCCDGKHLGPAVRATSGKAASTPKEEEDARRVITLRDALFVVEKERGHGAGAARRMGGCGDALFTALVLPAAVFSSPNIFPLLLLRCCCCVHFCITYQIAAPPPLLRDSP